MKNTMIRRLLTGILGTAALAAGAAEPVIDLSAKTEKLVAFQEPGKFCGWPANEGIWSWGDEILVGFELRDYLKSSKTHSADYSKPGRCVLARSLDGGRSWKLETPETFNRPEYIGDASRNDRQERPPRKLAEPLDFRAPGFAMKLRGTMFYTSADRGRNWDGPFRLEIAGVDPVSYTHLTLPTTERV